MKNLYTEHYYESDDGLQLYYRDYASRSVTETTPVLCLPGLTRNSRDFERLASRLSAHCQVLCPDFRGRGHSDYDKRWSHYNARQYALDTIRLLIEAGISRARLVGTSLGGLVSMVIADLEPSAVEAVVLNDIGPGADPTGLSRIVRSTGLLARASSFDEAVRYTRDNYQAALPDWSEADWRWYAATTYRLTDDGDYDLNYDRGIGVAVRRGAAPLPRDPWTLFDALRSIPTLVVRGALSDILTSAIVEKMRERKPDLRQVTVSNRGHAPILDEPEAYDAVESFLRAN